MNGRFVDRDHFLEVADGPFSKQTQLPGEREAAWNMFERTLLFTPLPLQRLTSKHGWSRSSDGLETRAERAHTFKPDFAAHLNGAQTLRQQQLRSLYPNSSSVLLRRRAIHALKESQEMLSRVERLAGNYCEIDILREVSINV